MTRTLVWSGLLGWVGATLLLSSWRRFSRPSLLERLLPYQPGPALRVGGWGVAGPGSVEGSPAAGSGPLAGIVAATGPLARRIGNRLAALLGVSEGVEVRLHRVHSPMDVTSFRLRQLGWASAGLLAAMLVAASGPPLGVDVLVLPGAPLLAFLVIEQRLATASAHWQDRIRWELPVVSEQIAMLLAAGYSLGSALNQVAARGQGCCARDLAAVTNRIRHGLTESQALREWAEATGVDSLDRLVGVLALHSEASDLGRMVSAEARSARRDLHRRTTELLEKRAQQVWVPVTVATLVPGVIFLAIPFLAALRAFSNA
ncbi:MAG: type II secretion system F family protein [Acidimicrobiales bacterium]